LNESFVFYFLITGDIPGLQFVWRKRRVNDPGF